MCVRSDFVVSKNILTFPNGSCNTFFPLYIHATVIAINAKLEANLSLYSFRGGEAQS
jgi:hypothetical protein